MMYRNTLVVRPQDTTRYPGGIQDSMSTKALNYGPKGTYLGVIIG